jgi:hypothetical protein
LEQWYFALLNDGRLPGALINNNALSKNLTAQHCLHIQSEERRLRTFPKASLELSDSMLEDFVTDEGWLKAKKFRDSKRDGWTFEPLTESRQAWEQRYGPQTWNEAKEWGEDNCEAVLANGYAGRHRSYSQTAQRCEGAN